MDDATEILAMTECLILWDYLAETGEESKFVAINRLFDDSKLAQDSYGEWHCPLCFHLRVSPWDDGYGCKDCLWPGKPDALSAKCEAYGSPFNTWRFSTLRAERKAAAKRVLELLESVEF